MAGERAPGIGDALREARERRGLTIRQIAASTKISVGVLEALERNDISRLPGGIFGRAFVRSYAIEVGLDPEQVIQDFLTQFPIDSVTVGHPTARPQEDREAADSDERVAWTIGRLIVASIPVAAVVLYIGGGFSGTDPVEETPPAQYALSIPPERTAPIAPLQPVESPRPQPLSVASDNEPLLVALSASGACWVSVQVDGRVVLERELAAGDRELFEVDRDFELIAGNAGAITMSLNGREFRSLGRQGQVVSVSFGRDNFEEFLIEP
ncbi:MAG: helix-turn-helix domain-containing protein [Vicinamibacterales bacterium]